MTFIYLVFLLLSKACFAQLDTSALYYKYPDTPPFTMTRVPDSTKFAKANLPLKKPLVVMIFSPDCDHCIHEVKALLANMDLFKKAQILLIGHLDFHYLKTFYEEYKLAITMNKPK